MPPTIGSDHILNQLNSSNSPIPLDQVSTHPPRCEHVQSGSLLIEPACIESHKAVAATSSTPCPELVDPVKDAGTPQLLDPQNLSPIRPPSLSSAEAEPTKQLPVQGYNGPPSPVRLSPMLPQIAAPPTIIILLHSALPVQVVTPLDMPLAIPLEPASITLKLLGINPSQGKRFGFSDGLDDDDLFFEDEAGIDTTRHRAQPVEDDASPSQFEEEAYEDSQCQQFSPIRSGDKSPRHPTPAHLAPRAIAFGSLIPHEACQGQRQVLEQPFRRPSSQMSRSEVRDNERAFLAIQRLTADRIRPSQDL